MNTPQSYTKQTTAFVITTAMLTFISYWRGAAVVLCDLASSAYYACGVAEQAVGKAAPWFILAIMLFSFCVRMVYMESCAMFVRGGVYRVVREAIGPSLAKISVSALLFDYILTGPISAVSAGHYLTAFINHICAFFGIHLQLDPHSTSMAIGVAITLYFWRQNVIGIEESSHKSLRIMQLTGVMTVVLLAWSAITLYLNPRPLPPFTPHLTDEALGWLSGFDWAHTIGAVGIIIALGHSLLAMSGEESLAQVYRELGAPKMKNLKRCAVIIFIASFTLTGIVSLLAVTIIPDDIRATYQDNLLSGLAMNLAGPHMARLILQGFVVVVGALILSGAVNTSFVGANGVLNRVAEDGLLPPVMRRPHPRFGTTSRMIHLITGLQLFTIFLCRGDVYTLGEAYAFGVIWSFVSQTLAVMVLRWKNRQQREFEVPVNFTIMGIHIPVGIFFVFAALFLMAIGNFFTKTVATKWGVVFTGLCYVALRLSEAYTRRKTGKDAQHHLERVNVQLESTATPETIGCEHDRRILVATRDPKSLIQLRRVLGEIDPKKTDIIVMTVNRVITPGQTTSEELPVEEQELLTQIVTVAEKFGLHVTPLIVPANDPIFAIAKAAYDLNVQEIILGKSEKTSVEVQVEKFTFAWGYITAHNPRKITVRVVWESSEYKYVLG